MDAPESDAAESETQLRPDPLGDPPAGGPSPDAAHAAEPDASDTARSEAETEAEAGGDTSEVGSAPRDETVGHTPGTGAAPDRGDSDLPAWPETTATAAAGMSGVPPAGVAGGGDETDLQQPSSIRNAVRLMWVGAVLSGLNILAVFLVRDDLRDLIEESDRSLTADQVDSALTTMMTVAGLIGVMAVALWIWMATANGQGRLWARTTATVLGALYVAVNLVAFVGGELTLPRVALGLLGIGLPVAILVLLYRPESTRFYNAVTRQAAQPTDYSSHYSSPYS